MQDPNEICILYRDSTVLLAAYFLLGYLLDPKDGGDMFLRTVSWLSTQYMALYPKRQNFS